MENVEQFLDWLVMLEIQHYKTEANDDYTPSGDSHFYLKGSQERFTSAEMISLFTCKASCDVNEKWLSATAEYIDYNKRH